jgi:5-methylcytosine-specific restriction endonuclease McrA
MPRSKSDLSNTAIRIFLQEVGSFYDRERGFEVFKPNGRQKQAVYEFFTGRCAYCDSPLDGDLATLDHLIPLNKAALGLHAWGNVVASCRHCNKDKHDKGWQAFLAVKAGDDFPRRRDRILTFIERYKYRPELGLHTIADNLYQDVGEVAMTLVRLRLRQAEDAIRAIITTSPPPSAAPPGPLSPGP